LEKWLPPTTDALNDAVTEFVKKFRYFLFVVFHPGGQLTVKAVLKVVLAKKLNYLVI
jgi:hypothetical protein